MERRERYSALFGQLVAMLHFAAMQQMGKIKSPITDTVERNLEAARHTIDTLDMLQARTKGNLTAEEDQFLAQMLKELKLNYVDEAAKGESVKGESGKGDPARSEPDPREPAKGAPPAGGPAPGAPAPGEPAPGNSGASSAPSDTSGGGAAS
jgi:hypothetical protein